MGKIVLLTGRSSELGLILQTSQVARGSAGLLARNCSLFKFQLGSKFLANPDYSFPGGATIRPLRHEGLPVPRNR